MNRVIMVIPWRLTLLLLLCFSVPAFAQDSHYWANQYGTRSTFMGGAVVGGVRDTSSGYYNPGALGFIEHPSLSVSADAIRISDLHVIDGVGGAADLDSEQVEVIPLLLSGIYKTDRFSDRHVFGYTALTKNSHQMKTSARVESEVDVLQNPTAPGSEEFIGQFTRDDRLIEVWGGLSYAYRVSERFSVGLTGFLALRDQAFSRATFARAFNRDQDVTAATDATSTVDFWNLRALVKAGAAADFGRWRAGVTVTTPSVNLFGTGVVAADFTVTNVDIDGDGIPDTFVADDRQEALDSEFRTPFSVAAGVEFELTKKTRVGASVEWFAQEDRYSVLVPESKEFIRSIGPFAAVDSRDFLRVTHGADDVINFGIGAERDLGRKVTGFLSFRTDYSYVPEEPGDGFPLGFTDWDLYHVSTGVNVKREHSDFGFGLTYSFGQRDDFPQLENFAQPTEAGFLTGDPGQAEAEYQAITFIVGGTFYFR